MRHRYIGGPADDHMAHTLIMFLDPRGNVFLHTGHIISRKIMTVRKQRKVLYRTADACKFLHISIPGLDIFIPDGPVNGETIPDIGFELIIAPSIALAPPRQAAPSHMIAAKPVETLDLGIWAFTVLAPVVQVGLT